MRRVAQTDGGGNTADGVVIGTLHFNEQPQPRRFVQLDPAVVQRPALPPLLVAQDPREPHCDQHFGGDLRIVDRDLQLLARFVESPRYGTLERHGCLARRSVLQLGRSHPQSATTRPQRTVGPIKDPIGLEHPAQVFGAECFESLTNGVV